MAYTLNSAKDSQGDEGQFIADFRKNQGSILAYQQQNGGDLEGAYQKVTGKPWPAGRSVKMSKGVPEMTKDRTVKSVLGKYVAPIAAAAAAPYLLPLLAGGGATTAAGIGAAGIGEAGAITGLAGSGFGGAALGGAAAAGGATATGGTLASTMLGTMGRLGSDAASSMATGRRADNITNANATNDNNQSAYNAATFNRDLPLQQARQVARGDLMSANIPQASFTGSGRDLRITGGVGPQYFGEDTRQAGEALKKQALADLMSGDKALTPAQVQPSRAGLGEDLTAGAGIGLNLLDAYRRMR